MLITKKTAFLRLVMVCVVAQSVSFGAAAQSATEEQTAVALELMDVTGAKAAMEAVLPALVQQQMVVVKSANPNISNETINRFEALLQEEFTKNSDILIRGTAEVYVRHLSVDDMQGLIDFYKTDLGKKVISKMPVILQESMAMGAILGAQMGKSAVENARKRAKEEGLDL